MQGQWKQESPAREYLEQLKCCHGTDCNEPMMKKGFTALKEWNMGRIKKPSGKKMKASGWAFDKIKEAFELVAQDETEKMSIVQEIMLRSTDFRRRQSEVREESQCLTCAQTATVSLGKTTFGGSLGERPQSGGAQFVEKSTTGGKHTGCWSCKRCGNLSKQRYFKAHAVLQGLCANLTNAWKLLANQQEDGDGLLQNIVTNLSTGSRKGLTDGLRDFIRVNNERALDVGALRRGTRTFRVRKPKVPEGCSDVTVRESPDELTEVGTSKAYTDVNHIEPENGVLPWLMLTGMPSARRCTKASRAKIGKKMYVSCKVMSKAVGVKKPQEAQKAKALWAMQAAKDRREEFYDPVRKDNILGRKKTILSILKIQLLR